MDIKSTKSINGIRQLSTLVLPNGSLFASEGLDVLEEVSSNRKLWCNAAAEKSDRWLIDFKSDMTNSGPLLIDDITHYLSPYFALRTKVSTYCSRRTSSEREVWKSLRSPCHVITASLEDFVLLLRQICSGLGLSRSWRTCWVESLPDFRGNRDRYPSPVAINNEISALYHYLREQFHKFPQLAAIVSYVALCTLHPLPDGNGRLARVVYNWLSNGQSDRLFYLPLYECGIASRGGQLIRVRQARHQSNWLPLVEYFAACLKSFAGSSHLL